MTKELRENNYMEALLRAALLLGDLHRTAPVREITISGFVIRNHIRKLYPRCRISVQPALDPYSPTTIVQDSSGEDYLILYPLRNFMPS